MLNRSSRDLTLPVWGPYNKKFVGFAHLADEKKGLRFDVDVFPGFYRRSLMQTRSISDGGARLWQARPDLQHFVYRYEMAENLYCDMHIAQEDEHLTARFVFVNHTDIYQSLQMNLCASIRLPTYMNNAILAADAHLPEGVRWVDAAAYDRAPGASLIPHDGLRRCEQPAPGAVGGFAADSSMLDQGGCFVYDCAASVLTLRYKAEKDAVLDINGQAVTLPACSSWSLLRLELPPADKLSLTPGSAPFLLDGFVLGEADESCFSDRPQVFVPRITREEQGARLYYPDLDKTYTLRWDAEDYVLRELHAKHVDMILADKIHEHVARQLYGEGEGHYTDLFLRPVFLPPRSEKLITVRLCAGDQEPQTVEELPLHRFHPNPSGEAYQLSQQLLAASTQLNVVWPQYFRGDYIKHNTPGKVWDCFYTWDSGMIAAGLLALDQRRGAECLNTYLLPEGDPHGPYVHHGSPVLTQIFAFRELMNQGGWDQCRLLYPGMRQAWRYIESLSRTGRLETGLITTWHLFYNSGGWDDYAPQLYMHRNHLTDQAAPCISTSFAILTAKALRQAAQQLGFEEDLPAYDEAISRLSASLQICWDEESGYFGYAMHDSEGRFTGLMRHESGVQYNMGLDGVYPLIAGACDAHQRERMLENIRQGLLTHCGVSAVDTRAPYFSHSGYWNGSVWMPHQWILWKSLMDQGEWQLANDIARTALDTWKREADLTHNCYEHFMIEGGRGAGFHHFSGLSSPVLTWFCGYHVPGHVQTGCLTLVKRQDWGGDCSSARLTFSCASEKSSVIVTMQAGREYAVTGCECTWLYDGTCVLHLQKGDTEVVIA